MNKSEFESLADIEEKLVNRGPNNNINVLLSVKKPTSLTPVEGERIPFQRQNSLFSGYSR